MKTILKFIDRLEKEMGGLFWLLSAFFGMMLSSSNHINKASVIQPDTPLRIEISSVTNISSGGGQDPQRKRKKFNLALHQRMEKTFPDWEERMVYQKKQEKFYKSAMAKEREVKRLRIRIKKNPNPYTKEELNAIEYFHGIGIFAEYQDPRLKPNIFDTRQTFLFKMHDPLARKNFINSFNEVKNY